MKIWVSTPVKHLGYREKEEGFYFHMHLSVSSLNDGVFILKTALRLLVDILWIDRKLDGAQDGMR